LATLNRAVLELSGRLIGQSEFAQILRDVGISDEAFEELFGSREDFEHEVLSHMIRKSALAGSLATGANTYEDGFRMLPSQAMELGPRLTFRAGRDDDSFKVLLQLAVGGMTRPDLLDRCRDCLHELDETWQAAPLTESLGLLQLELRAPFTAAEITEIFQMLVMGALLRELISPNPDREDILPRAVQALFLGFTREQGDHSTLRDCLDQIDDRWPFPQEEE